ncbi:DUF4331 domain-containing protein [Methylococcus sp. EFPC2]|uniref:DUF4331 domain-containing protein n=1 Tax=Methylococcus sp. EFPC2 TaxID=2812648 RepID=UPI001967743B|nr:DUF4331 domain-containing protein [Methylococcus sp. EFPC2]QSA97934.1 DUF4331 domain-containing protein [Methylococcus sp. EFPC2]
MQHAHFKTAALVPALLLALCGGIAHGANHREAPLTALDPKADITDFFAFVSYDDPGKVTLILDVDPLLEPANGPNYFPFDPEILYAIRVDNNNDAVEDVVFEFRFRTEIGLPGVFTAYVGAGTGFFAPAGSPAPVAPGTLIVPPAINSLTDAGLSVRQRYSVTMVKGGVRTVLGHDLIAVPSNVGPRTMPTYDQPLGLYEQGIRPLAGGVSVFAGTVDDPFWIDLGAAFDSLNFRVLGSGVPGVLTPAEIAAEQNFAADDVAGYNVNAIAIEVPIALLTRDGNRHAAGDPAATLGFWGTTSRPKVKTYSGNPGAPALVSSTWTQIQRMGQPLFNELIIGTGSKDKFSMSQPKNDAQFASFALDPLLARVINAVYAVLAPPGVSIPTPPRTDLLPLVTYAPPIAAPGTPAGPVADLLRLNTGVPPTSPTSPTYSRLGLLGSDPAGYPNGRRLGDDVTDIAAQAVVGVFNPAFNVFPNNAIGDGVNDNDKPYRATFPYLAPAHSGRDSRHIDPGEAGCTAGAGPACAF